MKKNKYYFFIVACFVFFVISDSQGADFQEIECPRHIAPGSFHNPGNAWNGTDTGVVIDGFADLQNEENKIFKVTHGIDLSRHNIVNYKMIKDCGGEFAFLRIDDKYKDHSFKLLSNQVTVIPYYFFPIPKNLRIKSIFSNKNQETITKELELFQDIGVKAAKRFLEKLLEVEPNGLPEISLSGLSGRFVALDVEEKLLDERGSTELERAYYGRSYARAVCSWLTTVKKAYPELILMMYTTPSLNSDYLDKAYAEDHACLQEIPIWVARTTKDGGDVIRSSQNTIDKQAQRLCLVSGGNRCVNHQYTHRAIFATLGKKRNGHPRSIDLNRFFDVRTVHNEAGVLHVRSNVLQSNTEVVEKN